MTPAFHFNRLGLNDQQIEVLVGFPCKQFAIYREGEFRVELEVTTAAGMIRMAPGDWLVGQEGRFELVPADKFGQRFDVVGSCDPAFGGPKDFNCKFFAIPKDQPGTGDTAGADHGRPPQVGGRADEAGGPEVSTRDLRIQRDRAIAFSTEGIGFLQTNLENGQLLGVIPDATEAIRGWTARWEKRLTEIETP